MEMEARGPWPSPARSPPEPAVPRHPPHCCGGSQLPSRASHTWDPAPQAWWFPGPQILLHLGTSQPPSVPQSQPHPGPGPTALPDPGPWCPGDSCTEARALQPCWLPPAGQPGHEDGGGSQHTQPSPPSLLPGQRLHPRLARPRRAPPAPAQRPHGH